MDLTLSLIAGFFTSLHCIGMCGGLVACYAVQPGSGRVLTGLPSHLSYNGGRLLSYSFLGGVAGLAGKALGSLHTIGPWFSIVAGVFMVGLGLVMFGIVPGWNLQEPNSQGWLRRLHLQSVADLLQHRSPEGAFYVGLLTPLLPCGMLYAMALKAAETASVASGALTMLAFGAGTVPALFATGIITTLASVRLRLHATRVAALIVIVMGVLLVIRGVGKLNV
jgi:sulfite exporter TauE/SafE